MTELAAELRAWADRIDSDLALCDAATPGPWRTVKDAMYPGYVSGIGLHDGVHSVPFQFANEEDAAFIAAAREGWPKALLALREAAQALVENPQSIPPSSAVDRDEIVRLIVDLREPSTTPARIWRDGAGGAAGALAIMVAERLEAAIGLTEEDVARG